jgi:hypothetical protein
MLVQALQLDDLIEQVPEEAAYREVPLKVVLHVEGLLVLEYLLHESVESALIVEADERLKVTVLANHRLDYLPEPLILKHQRQSTETEDLGISDDFMIYGVQTHEKTYKEVL